MEHIGSCNPRAVAWILARQCLAENGRCPRLLVLNAERDFYMKISNRPSPHPLDYDWRFDEKCIKNIIDTFDGETKILCLGTPSVSERLIGEDYILVDWHPIQTADNHLKLNLNIHSVIKTDAKFVVMDPPWYLDIYYRWISWACNAVTPPAKILFPIWHDDTRPLAKKEKEELFNWLSLYGNYTIEKNSITYVSSQFETNSNLTFKNKKNRRVADLVSFSIISKPLLHPPILQNENWTRYIFDDYQLAIRTEPKPLLKNENQDEMKISFVDGLNSWIFPSVSKRASGRNSINIWSSENEAGIINQPEKLILILDNAIENGFTEKNISELREIRQWDIPLPPFKRVLKWYQKS
jgi:hypothetical protein